MGCIQSCNRKNSPPPDENVYRRSTYTDDEWIEQIIINGKMYFHFTWFDEMIEKLSTIYNDNDKDKDNDYIKILEEKLNNLKKEKERKWIELSCDCYNCCE
jgi:hypothetical protein